jgi:ubiquinone/menaquinone biosynthesis C-methylase UbiE
VDVAFVTLPPRFENRYSRPMSTPLRYGRDAAARVQAIYRTPEIAAQRRACLALLAGRPGEHVLDLGCGPGLLAVELAAAVGPTGTVTAADISADMLVLTRDAAAGAGVGLRVVRADATALPLPDAGLDAAITVQTLEFVPAVDRALAELLRVLRPGGRLLVLDTDWSEVDWHSADPSRRARFLAAWSAATAWPSLPRTLPARLAAAGFIDIETHDFPLGGTDFDGYAARQIDHMCATILDRSALPAAEVAAVRAEQHDLARAGRFSFRLRRGIAVAGRPGAAMTTR